MNPRLEGVWGALDADAEDIIRQTLARLEQVDELLLGNGSETSYAASAAGVKALEEIQFAGTGAAVTSQLKRLGRTLVGRLSSIIGVPVYADVFGESGWPGDSYSANGIAGGGNGGFPLG
jgi:hypothetical protein